VSVPDIKSAYRRQARKHHPDRLFNAPAQLRLEAEERMKLINRAFADALSAIGKTPTQAENAQSVPAARFQSGRKHFVSKWLATSARPPFTASNVHMIRRTKGFRRRAVRRVAALVFLGIIAWFWFRFVTSTNPANLPWWDSPVVSGTVVVSAAFFAGLAGALYGYGTRAAAWTLVLTGFTLVAGFWYRGLEKAIEFERKHPETTRYGASYDR
jgi:hypothetical protein